MKEKTHLFKIKRAKTYLLVFAGILISLFLLPYSGGMDSENLKLKIPKVNLKNPTVFTLTGAKFFGTDNKGRPFSIEIKKAIEQSKIDKDVLLSDVQGEVTLDEKRWGGIFASYGRYNKETKILTLFDNVTFITDDGYKIDAAELIIDTKNMTATSSSRVIIQNGENTIEGQGLDFNLNGNIILKGNIKAKIRQDMIQGIK